MKAPQFAYVSAGSVADAVAAYKSSDDPKYIAGGQSLLAALNLRLLAPDLLIDISRIDELNGIDRRGDAIRIGALTRHAEILESPVIAEAVPMLSLAAPFVAHPAIRNKGTIGGSLALADPASEFPAVALALHARFEISDGAQTRFVDAPDYFLDLYETAIQPGEILVAIHFPVANPSQRFVFDELARRRGDFAIVGVAMAVDVGVNAINSLQIVLFSVGPTPMRARNAEAVLAATSLSDSNISAALDALGQDIAPSGDPGVSAETRLHLARVLLRRNLLRLRDSLWK